MAGAKGVRVVEAADHGKVLLERSQRLHGGRQRIVRAVVFGKPFVDVDTIGRIDIR